MLLIHPPVARSCEAPAGIAGLAGFLNNHGGPCQVVDLNLEGIRHLIGNPGCPEGAEDTWTRRALKNRSAQLKKLSSWETYVQIDRHGSAVRSLNRVLVASQRQGGIRITLTDYSDSLLSPTRSADLISAATDPASNPFYPYFSERLSALIEGRNPRAVGISLNYLSQALCSFAVIGFLRKHYPELKIVLGGGLVSSWLSRPDWRDPFSGWVDKLVAGPGEAYLADLFGLEDRRRISPPDYGGFALSDYLAPGRILPYSASRGCWWRNCVFCPEKAEKNAYHPISPEQVQADLRILIETTRPVLIHFLDNALSPALLRALIRRPPGIPWYGFARITPELSDPDFCRALRASGCVMLKMGLESGDQGVLDSLGKGVDLGQAALSLQQLRRAGIGTYVYLLFGTPAETMEAAERTLMFVCRHAEQIHYLNLAIFNLPVFSPEAADLETQPFYEGDLSLYTNFCHPRGWTRRRIRRFLDRSFRCHPVIAPILRRDPVCFTSSHAPLFLISDCRRMSSRLAGDRRGKGAERDSG